MPAAAHDSVAAFIADRVSRTTGAAIRAGALYRVYCEWCAGQDQAALSLTMFGRRMAELGVRKSMAGNRVSYLDLARSTTSHAKNSNSRRIVEGEGALRSSK